MFLGLHLARLHSSANILKKQSRIPPWSMHVWHLTTASRIEEALPPSLGVTYTLRTPHNAAPLYNAGSLFSPRHRVLLLACESQLQSGTLGGFFDMLVTFRLRADRTVYSYMFPSTWPPKVDIRLRTLVHAACQMQ